MKKLLLTILLLIPFNALAAGDPSLAWEKMLVREDNKVMTIDELAGYKIYYGTSSGVYTESLTLNDNATENHTFSTFDKGNYYFVITQFDTDGRESQNSPEVFLTVDNSVAIVTGDNSCSLAEYPDLNNDGVLICTGKLSVIDYDTGEDIFNENNVVTQYGNFDIDIDGNWNYIDDANLPIIDKLNDGDALTDVVLVSTNDGSETAVTVTINGVSEVLLSPKPVNSFTGHSTTK